MTTKNVVGVYRGMAHWHRLSETPAGGVGWGLGLEPELKPPRGSDFALDISPPPPYGPQDFAIEVTFTRRITTSRLVFAWPCTALIIGALVSAAASIWLPESPTRHFLSWLGIGMSFTAVLISAYYARKSWRALKASEARLRKLLSEDPPGD